MNNASILAAAALLVATTSSAFAQEYVAPDAGFVSTKTRAEVSAELQEARADGSRLMQNTEVVNFASAQSTKSRAEVRQELVSAQADGIASTQLVDGMYPVMASQSAGKSRAEVLAELEAYRAQNPRGDVYASYQHHLKF